MNAAFPLTFLRGLWGEMCISSANAAPHIKVFGHGDISLFVLQAVWPSVAGLAHKHTQTHTPTEQSFVFTIMNWIRRVWPTIDWKTRVSFSLFHISQPLWVEFFLSTVKSGLVNAEKQISFFLKAGLISVSRWSKIKIRTFWIFEKKLSQL